MPFDIFKKRVNFKSIWVRKLIGKLGVRYNRGLGVRGSLHPLYYDADLSLPAADSNAFRNQSALSCPDRTLWSGDVEVFELTDHPKVKRCHGWTYGEPEEFITILELPPVTDMLSAVKVGVSYQIKKARKNEYKCFGGFQ
jgi:hypothetical protein